MKRQVTKDITSYFPMVSKKIANLQTAKNFLELEVKLNERSEPVINE